jgi:hypothetical protein
MKPSLEMSYGTNINDSFHQMGIPADPRERFICD